MGADPDCAVVQVVDVKRAPAQRVCQRDVLHRRPATRRFNGWELSIHNNALLRIAWHGYQTPLIYPARDADPALGNIQQVSSSIQNLPGMHLRTGISSHLFS